MGTVSTAWSFHPLLSRRLIAMGHISGVAETVEYPDVWGHVATGVKSKHIEVTLN